MDYTVTELFVLMGGEPAGAILVEEKTMPILPPRFLAILHYLHYLRCLGLEVRGMRGVPR